MGSPAWAVAAMLTVLASAEAERMTMPLTFAWSTDVVNPISMAFADPKVFGETVLGTVKITG